MSKIENDYFERAGSWAAERDASVANSRRLAWVMAGVAIGIALIEAVALVALAPLKTVVPITLLVDRQTGFVQALDPLKPSSLGHDDALTRSFLVQYVIAREGFDAASLQADYRKVALWSAGPARAAYLSSMQSGNPESPLRKYAHGMQMRVFPKSVSALGRGTALVRFDTSVAQGSSEAGTAQHWAAVVRYGYSDAPMRTEDRFLNPLGFQVTSYHRDPEALPQDGAGSSPTPPQDRLGQGGPSTTPGQVAIILPQRSVPMGSPLSPSQRSPR